MLKPYYRTCTRCGANLDPGERCRCGQKKEPGAEAPSPRTEVPTTTAIISQAVGSVKAAQLARQCRRQIAAMIR